MSTTTRLSKLVALTSVTAPSVLAVQGLADTFIVIRLPFDSLKLNIRIFETTYHGVLEASSDLAEVEGSYETWIGSWAEQGQVLYVLRKESCNFLLSYYQAHPSTLKLLQHA